MAQPTIRFSVIGLNHNHIYSQVNLLLRAGAELADFFALEPDLAADFARAYPQARPADSAEEILEDPSISADRQRGHPLRPRAARHCGDAARQGFHER